MKFITTRKFCLGIKWLMLTTLNKIGLHQMLVLLSVFSSTPPMASRHFKLTHITNEFLCPTDTGFSLWDPCLSFLEYYFERPGHRHWLSCLLFPPLRLCTCHETCVPLALYSSWRTTYIVGIISVSIISQACLLHPYIYSNT